MGVLVLAFLMLLPVFVTGLVLVIVASKGMRAVRTCSCGYDLSGLPRESPCCPECGARRGHVTIRHPRMLTIGLVVMLLPFALLALGVVFTAWRLL